MVIDELLVGKEDCALARLYHSTKELSLGNSEILIRRQNNDAASGLPWEGVPVPSVSYTIGRSSEKAGYLSLSSVANAGNYHRICERSHLESQ